MQAMSGAPSISYSITVRLEGPARGNAVSQLGGGNVFDNDLVLGPEAVERERLRDKARRIPNFNDGYLGKAPDIGAEEMR